MTKPVLLLCLIVLVATGGVIYALTTLSSEMHRTAVALDLLSGRMSVAERDLGAIADEMYEIAEGVNAIADSLTEDDEDTEQGESVRLPGRATPHRFRAQARREHRRPSDVLARRAARRERRSERASVAPARAR